MKHHACPPILIAIASLLFPFAHRLEWAWTGSYLPLPVWFLSAVYDGHDLIYVIGGYDTLLTQKNVVKFSIMDNSVRVIGTFINVAGGLMAWYSKVLGLVTCSSIPTLWSHTLFPNRNHTTATIHNSFQIIGLMLYKNDKTKDAVNQDALCTVQLFKYRSYFVLKVQWWFPRSFVNSVNSSWLSSWSISTQIKWPGMIGESYCFCNFLQS